MSTQNFMHYILDRYSKTPKKGDSNIVILNCISCVNIYSDKDTLSTRHFSSDFLWSFLSDWNQANSQVHDDRTNSNDRSCKVK